MSLLLGSEGRAAAEALRAFDACDRMLAELAEAIARHEYAASLARPDWEGPHREAFDDRFAQVQYRLRVGELFVLHVQAVARAAMAADVPRPEGSW